MKKVILLGAGVLLVLGLLFGRNLVPYASTAFDNVRTWANDQVDTNFQIDAARKQLDSVHSSIKPMLWQIAKEEVEINRLAQQMADQEQALVKREAHILKLRNHLDSGEAQYVSKGGATYRNAQVRKDLANVFEQFKLTQSTYEKTQQILELRRQGLEAAKEELKETIAQRKELEIQIENLEARKQMLDVAKTAGKFNIDNSELSQARQMIEDIKTRLDVEAQYMNMAPIYSGEIPMDGEEVETDNTDIIDAVDAYFGINSGDASVAKN